nr:MAG TPA: hypothetical protein [Caudoviricetes sp.]
MRFILCKLRQKCQIFCLSGCFTFRFIIFANIPNLLIYNVLHALLFCIKIHYLYKYTLLL